MSEIAEYFNALRIEAQATGAEKRQESAELYDQARAVAREYGYTLTHHNGGAQYNLKSPAGWLISMYPGNQRLFDPNRKKGPRAPFIDIAAPYWTVLDVVLYVVRMEQRHTLGAQA